MKKLRSPAAFLLCVLALLLALSGCGTAGKAPTSSLAPASSAESPKEEPKPTEADLDLTKLSSTMVYAEVYNMMTSPEDYTGRRIRMRGQFALYHDEQTKQNYYAVIIADATACCQQGLEFVWLGEHRYPDDYPPLGTEIEVCGIFEVYLEDGVTYCHLLTEQLEVKQKAE